VVGVDLDPRVKENPLLDEAVVVEPGPLPFGDGSFDLVFAIYVLEHVNDPVGFAREIHRILKPGGLFLALTPNRYHYVSVIASLTPTVFHKWVNARRGIDLEDTFPTLYLMNTRRSLRRLFVRGFNCVRMDTLEIAPNYLRFSTPTFLLGALYERIVNRFNWLAALRVNILCVFQRT
jgi:SAM-dependent methyltransferase